MLTCEAQSHRVQLKKRKAALQSPIDGTRVGAVWFVSDMAARSASVQPLPQVRASFK
jgi:hypothetical protein